MCIFTKRAPHSQSDVEVTLSIANFLKIHQKSAPDPHAEVYSLHPCCILVASPSYVGGFRTPRGTRKSMYNLFMDLVWSDLGANLAPLGPTWTQLGPNLDPTWHQLQPTCANDHQSGPNVIKK